MLNTQKLCLLLALSLTVCTVATSQDQSPVAIMTMMDAEDVGMYMDVELDIWKPVHAQRIRDGEIIGWYLYAVALDNGEDYNYATVEVYPNWNSLETMYSTIDKVFEEVHGADQDSLDWMSDQTQKSRDIVRSYRWSRAMGVFGDNVGDSKYYTIDWMDIKPGHGGQYYRMEGDYYKPVHQKRVDAGKITSA